MPGLTPSLRYTRDVYGRGGSATEWFCEMKGYSTFILQHLAMSSDKPDDYSMHTELKRLSFLSSVLGVVTSLPLQ